MGGVEASSTPDRVLNALVDVILEGGLPGFSVQEVADRAGVSHRTVYRYFPTRDALLEGLSEAVDRRMRAAGSVSDLDTIDELPGAALVNFGLFSRERRAVEAGVRFRIGAALEEPDRTRRTKRFQAVVAESLPALSAEDAAMAGAALRQVVSSPAWLALVAESGLDDQQAARASAWAAAVMVDALRTGRTPSREPLDVPMDQGGE